MQRRDFKKRRLFIQCLSIAVGILLSIGAFWYAKDRADFHFIERFNAIAEIRTSILTANLSYSLEYVEIMGSYYDLSGRISRKDFDRFASPHILNDKCILAFEWVPAVPDALRRVYEEKARNEGLGYFRIWEYDSHGNAVPANRRNTYYPIYFKYPGDYSRQLLGLDVGADPESMKLLEEAIDSGETLATRPFVPIEFKNRQYAFLVVKPVYFKNMPSNTVHERRNSHKGFILGVFGAANIVESGIRSTPPMNMPFDIYDISVPEGYMLLYHSKPGRGPEKWNSFLSVFYPDYPEFNKEFSFAGRKYMVSITAGPAYLKNNYSLNYYLILLIGAVLTFFGVFYIRSVFRQREQAMILIDQRTMELSESRELFRTVFQYSGIGIAMLDTEGNYLEVNRTFSLIVGYGIEELVSMNFRDITLADDIEYQNGKMQQILDGRIDNYSMEKRYVCKDGGIKWVLMNVSIIRSEEGFPRYFISHLYDISERKKTLNKLIASEARYEQVVSMINDIIWRYEVDARGEFVSSYISPVADSMLMQPKGTIGNSFEKYFSFVSPEDLPAVRDILSSVLANPEKDVTIEYRMLRPDGAVLWFCSNGSAHLQPDGHVVGFGSTTDITERKQAEIALLEYRDKLEGLVGERTLELEKKNLKLADEIEERKRVEDALKESEQRFKSLVENIQGLVWRCLNDENWTALYVSDFIEKLSGYPASDYIGNKERSLASDVHPDDIERVFREINKAVDEKRSYSIEYRTLNRDGSIIWVNERGKGVFNDEGRVLFLDGITLDITEKKQMEHALAESEQRFRTLFESSPTPMWVEDFSLVRKRMDDLESSGISDLRAYLDINHDEIMNMASMVRVLDINQASLDDLNAGSIEEMAENISMYFTGESIEVFKEELVMLYEGKTAFDCEIPIVNASGKGVLYHLYVKVWPGHEDDLSRLMLSFYNITERKHIEQEIRNSQERLRLIIENSNDIFVLIDRKGNQAYISPIVEKLTGYAPEELLHKPFGVVIYPEDLDYVNEAWKKCLENPGVPIRLIYRHIHKEKGYVWFEAIITNYLDNPAVCAIVDNVRDITDRKQIEDALKESEAKYRFLVDNMSDVLWTTDLNMNTTYVSPSIIQMGFTQQERCMQKIEEQMTPESIKKCTEKILEEMERDKQPGVEKDRVVMMQIEQYMKDGSTRYYEHRIKPLRNGDGDITGFQGVANDIHERKRAEEYIRKLSGAVEESTAAIIIANREGIIEYVNPSFITSTGYEALEVIGKGIGITNPDLYPQRIETELSRIIETGKGWKGEVRTRKKSGEIFWEHASLSAIHNESGEVTHFVAIREDISRRKKMEEELFQAKEAAEAANKAKSSFLANMSHELRTPLNAIIGFSQVLKEDFYGSLNEKQLEFVNDIEKGGYHLLTLINDILDLSKIEAGNIQLELKEFNISELARTSMTVIEQKAARHGIILNFECAPDVKDINVLADEIKIKQVLYNLLSNASKFTPDNGAISLKLNRDESMVYVNVTDTGIGIEPRYAEKIFEPFFQVMGAHQEKVRGTGLGMSISRQIIEMHGGSIWVESEGPGKGSSFTFSLPAKI